MPLNLRISYIACVIFSRVAPSISTPQIAFEDSVVAVSNSISFYEALRENKISAAQCRMDRKQ